MKHVAESTDLSKPINLPNLENVQVDGPIIDAHHHFFGLDALYYPWLSDRPNETFLLGNYDAIKRNYLPTDYVKDVGDLPVVKTVHIEAEADPNHPVKETHWLAKLHSETGKPTALVPHATLNLDKIDEILAEHKKCPLVRSIRSKPITSVTADKRSDVFGHPGSLQDPNWLRGLRALEDAGLAWDLRVPFWHLGEAAQVLQHIPELSVVVEHCGLPWDRSDNGLTIWRNHLKILAENPNIYIKISEMGLAVRPWDYEENRIIVQEVINIFGFERSMFASNFPVAGLRIPYDTQLKAIWHMVSDASPTERAALFHDSAARFYRL